VQSKQSLSRAVSRPVAALGAAAVTLLLAACGGGADEPSRQAPAAVAGNAAPVVTITSPAAGSTYKSGDTLTVSATATDAEDGTLAAASLTWWVDQHHDDHSHPMRLQTVGAGGTITVPTRNETSHNVWLRIHVRATDSAGDSTESTLDVFPRTADFTLATVPAGLQLTLDGAAITAPLTVRGVVGVERDLDAPEQVASGRRYRFSQWSDGGEQAHTLATPQTATTYTATFVDNGPATNQLPVVTLTVPSTAAAGTPVTLTALAADPDGTVAKVDFYEGGKLVGTSSTSPYSVSWTPSTSGARTIVAAAADDSGAVGSSAPSTVTVGALQEGGLKGEYFVGTALSGAPVLTRYEAVNLVLVETDSTASPGPGVPTNGWSARWTGFVRLPLSGTYTLQLVADDGARFWVNGQKVADYWAGGGNVRYDAPSLVGVAGDLIAVTIEHYDGTGDSTVKLRWKAPDVPAYWVPVPATQLVSGTSQVNQAPTVSLAAPAQVTAGVPVTLEATAADNDGNVAKVEFFDGPTLLGSDESAPYTIAWTPTIVATHALSARVTDNAGGAATSTLVNVVVAPALVPGGLVGTYYPNVTLTGPPSFTRTEAVDFVWATSLGTASPGGGMPSDGWSVRWVGYVRLPADGSYQFQVMADDGIRATINGASIVDRWSGSGNSSWQSSVITGTAGTLLPVTIEHFDGTGDSTVKLRWKTPSDPVYWAVVPAAQLYGAGSVPNLPPTVTLSAPSSGSVGTAVTLGATAADSDGTVVKVEFFDGATLVASSVTGPYAVQWTPTTAGTHKLTARATDDRGAFGVSAEVAVAVVAPNVPPTVVVGAPATATVGVPVTLSATAADSDGSVAAVTFFDGSTLIGAAISPPYTVSWTPAAPGTATITARATDNSGAVTTSAAIAVAVSDAPQADGGLLASYFANPTLTGDAVLTRVEVLDFTWAGTQASPGAGLPADGWSARWTGFVELPDAGSYQFRVTADDGIRAWINGAQIADRWSNSGNTTFDSQVITGSAGMLVPVTVEHYDGSGDSTVRLSWKTPSQSQYWTAVPAAQLQNDGSAPMNSPPSVAIAAPATATVGTAVSVSATATDSDGTVAKVEFFDGATLIATDASSPFQASWTPASAGVHALSARATDDGGAVTTSVAASVTVAPADGQDVQAPAVAITSPANFADNLGGTLTITASASDDVGVTGVEIEVDGVLVADDTAAPYQASVVTTQYATGQHVIRARARDAAGNRSPWAVATVRFSDASFRNVGAAFTRTENWVTGLSAATAIAQAPDGRFFVSVQDGRVLIIRNGAVLATPFLTLAPDTSGERGLLGLALHPNFAVNGWVYVYYTRVNGSQYNNRISRFVANADVSTGVETVIADLPALSGVNHNGGALVFGTDGKLYVGVGDNANTTKPQNLSDPLGKLLRFNDDGSIPSDNPFCTTQGNIACAVWAYGLRNPFTMAVQAGTGRLLLNDVGLNTWEEINLAARGANYGWPASEGPDNLTPAYTAPVFVYKHEDAVPPGSGPGGFLTGKAVIGGAFYPSSGGTFPASYQGKYFFADYVYRWVAVLDPTRDYIAYTFATIAEFPVGMIVGQDGALYILGRDTIARLAPK
jgi:glucose/arabinose dehydrogenase